MMADMSVVSAAWSGLAGGASAATLVALAGILLSVASLWRLRIDYMIAEAAERSEAVGLSAIVQKYVPGEMQSQKASEEIPIVKQVICLRWTRWKWLAIVLGALMLFSGAATAYLTRRNLESPAVAADPAARARPNLDAIKLLQGVWGWRADFQQSCSQNPQTISVSPGNAKVSLDYAKPYWTQQHFEYAVVSARSNMIVLKLLNAATNPGPQQVTLTINFQDANTFLLTNSNQPLQAYGTIERCH